MRAMIPLMEPPKKTVQAEYDKLPGKVVAVVPLVPDDILFDYLQVDVQIAQAVQAQIDRGVNRGQDKPPNAWGQSKEPAPKAQTRFIPAARVRALQERELDWQLQSPSKIGAELGADLVLWVEVTEFSTREPDAPDLYRGVLNASCTLFEVGKENRNVLWTGSVRTSYPEGRPVGIADENDARVRSETLRLFSEALARKFYDHTVEDK